MLGFDYKEETEVVVCEPIEDYMNSRCRNIITVDLDKMSDLGTDYKEIENIFHHYILSDKIGFEQKCLPIRIPGGSVGCICFDENNVITECFVETDYVLNSYWRNVNKHLQKYVGQKIVFRKETKSN